MCYYVIWNTILFYKNNIYKNIYFASEVFSIFVRINGVYPKEEIKNVTVQYDYIIIYKYIFLILIWNKCDLNALYKTKQKNNIQV